MSFLKVGTWKIPLRSLNDTSIKSYSRKERFIIDKHLDEIVVEIKTTLSDVMAVKLGYDPSPVDTKTGAMYAGAILIFLNILIISEVSKYDL